MVHIDMIVRTNRKSVSITITPKGEVLIKAPRKCTIAQIQSIVEKKENWIKLHQEKILNNQTLNENIFNYRDVLFCGQVYHIASSDTTKKIELKEDYCIVPTKQVTNLVSNLEKWYKKISMPILWGRVSYFANLMQVEPTKVRLSNARGCWGSCNSLGVISLNWRLIMVPHDLIDYVVVHELAHLLQMNHSPLFWNVVKSVLPDYQNRRKLLKKGDYLLSLYRTR